MNKLVYIFGSGHSGSTLLETLLAVHPSIFSAGEIHRFSVAVDSNEEALKCNCGKSINQCNFWNEIILIISKKYNIKLQRFIDMFPTTAPEYGKLISEGTYLIEDATPKIKHSDFWKLIVCILGRAGLNLINKISTSWSQELVYAGNSLQLFNCITKVSGKNVIIDSTKNPIRMKALNHLYHEKIKIIYLVRDGRAVCWSRMRRKNVSIKQAAVVWRNEQIKQKLALSRMPEENILKINYEELCKQTATVINEICMFLNLADLKITSQLIKGDFHGLGGNPMRFNSSQNTVKFDETWKSKLTTKELHIFNKTAGWFNSKNGYL